MKSQFGKLVVLSIVAWFLETFVTGVVLTKEEDVKFSNSVDAGPFPIPPDDDQIARNHTMA